MSFYLTYLLDKLLLVVGLSTQMHGKFKDWAIFIHFAMQVDSSYKHSL